MGRPKGSTGTTRPKVWILPASFTTATPCLHALASLAIDYYAPLFTVFPPALVPSGADGRLTLMSYLDASLDVRKDPLRLGFYSCLGGA